MNIRSYSFSSFATEVETFDTQSLASSQEDQVPSFEELWEYDRLAGRSYWPTTLVNAERNGHISFNGKPYSAELVPLAWGVHALGLKPLNSELDQPPILAFPGTSFEVDGGLKGATILADLDPLGPGYSLVRDSESSIRAWLESAGGQAVMVGHSLGGALATQAAVRCPGLVSRVVTFNSPMVSRSIAQTYRDTNEADRASVYNYFLKGDMVAKLGPEDIGHSFEVQSTGRHNAKLFCGKDEMPEVKEVTRQSSSWIHVACVFVVLSLAFLLLGTVALVAAIFVPPRGLKVQEGTKFFQPSTPAEACVTDSRETLAEPAVSS
jgi:predicted alpha/beta hydrolase family esterase